MRGRPTTGRPRPASPRFTLIAAQELERYGVTVNAIAPGALTRLTEDLGLPDEVTSRFEPRWVAPVVTWLASPLSADVTGQVIESSGLVLAIAEGWRRGPSTDHPPAEAGGGRRHRAQAAGRRPAAHDDGRRQLIVDGSVVLYQREGNVALVTINRPWARNTITYEVLDALLAVFARVDADDEVRAVVVTGAGEFFSAGTDLSTGAGGYDADSTGFKPLRGGTRDVGGELALRVFALAKPVIAAINGTAAGIGVTMVLPMDVRIGAEGSRFALPFTRRGIVPESCATWFLPRIVGIATAVDWAITGRTFGADEALAAGLVRELLPPAQVLPRALEVATEIAERTSAVSVALTRQMLWRQLGEPDPLAANRLESKALLALGTMGDAAEGVASFKEKRPPRFPLTLADLPDFYPWWSDEPF